MKNTRTTRLVALGLGALLAGSLAACTNTASPNPGSTQFPGWAPDNSRPENEVHLLVLGDAAGAPEKAAAERFNQTSNVKIVVDTGSIAGADYTTQIRSQIGTSTGPDISMSWGAAGIQPLVSAKGLLPLDSFIAQTPELKSMFLPSVFQQEVIDGSTYGIPVRGIGPVSLYYNTKVLADAGLKPATTYAELLDQVDTLKSRDVTPIALAGADPWTNQMWVQYMYARSIGNTEVAKGLAGDQSVWTSTGSTKALDDLTTLIQSGAFGSNYASVKYSSDGSPALLRAGKAAYELMGSWEYSTIGDTTNLGWTAFPSLAGGAGNPKEIVGNLSNYYNVAANTRYPETVRAFLEELYSPDFVKAQLAVGTLPPTTNAAALVDEDTTLDAKGKESLKYILGLVSDAPTFQLSWDQVVPASQSTTLQKLCANFFAGTVDVDQFQQQMQAITTAK